MNDAYIVDLATLALDGAAGSGASVPVATEGRGKAAFGPLVRAADLAAAVDAAGLVGFPTDTVYGIGGRCRASTYEAIAAAKRRVQDRGPDKPLQVVFPTLGLLLDTLDPGPGLAVALRRLLPGPVTLIVPYPDGFDGPPPGLAWSGAGEGTTPAESAAPADELLGREGERSTPGVRTLGVRVPLWPAAARAMASLPWPLVASSANLAGAPPARRLADVAPAVRAACDLMLDGGEVGGVASTVVDLTDHAARGRWRILREGALTRAELTAALGPQTGG